MLRISNQGVILAFAMLVLLLGANAGITYRNTVRLHEESASVQKTYATIEAIDDTLAAINDAEIGQRSFLITGDDKYLEPYVAGSTILKARLEKLHELIAEDRQERLSNLEAGIGKKLEELAHTLDLRRQESGLEGAREQMLTGNARSSMEALRALGQEMVDEEKRLLADRSKSSDDTFRTAILSGLATAAASILLVIVTVHLLRRNIQARTRAAHELEEQHDLLQTTLASIAEGIVVTDAAERVTYMNRIAQVMTGQSLSLAHGRPIAEVVHMREDGADGAGDGRTVPGGADGAAAAGQVLISADGVKRIVDERAAPLLSRSEARIGTVRAIRDVTAQRENLLLIEALLHGEKHNAQRLHQLADAASTLNSSHSRERVLEVLREEARTILGYEDAVVVLDPAVKPDPGAGLSVPLVGSGGRTLGKVDLVRPTHADASKDENARAILQQLSHIASVALENARLYEELREGDRRKDEFLATLAHELRNPLAPVRNSLQIIRSSRAGAVDRERALGSIDRQVTLLVRLVDDLLDVSRITRGKVALKLQQVELADIVAQALETSRAVVELSGNTLAVDMPTVPVLLEADPVRLAQVVSNLLANAAKYTDRGGHILLACEATESHAVIRVRDDGIGIAPDLLPRIFDMFWQVDHALERAQGGLGIGLTLVRQLVELHGGTVAARSEGPGLGTEFTIRLPRLSAGTLTLERPAPPASEPEPREVQPQRVVVVDDNLDSAESLALLLRLQGHEVMTAHDGLAAIALVKEFAPALVLLDIGLPRMNGYDVAREIRAQGSRTVLAAMTGWSQVDDRRRSQEAGFDHHLAKPVDLAQLQRIIAALGAPAG